MARTQATSCHVPVTPGGRDLLQQSSEQEGGAGSSPGVCREEASQAVHQGAQLTDQLKLHRGPLNEDVFSAQSPVEEKDPPPSIQGLTEQIHRLLLQVGMLPTRPPVPLCQWPGAAQRPGLAISLHPAPLCAPGIRGLGLDSRAHLWLAQLGVAPLHIWGAYV